MDIQHIIKKVGETQTVQCTGTGNKEMRINWVAGGANSRQQLKGSLGGFNAGTKVSTLTLRYSRLRPL